MITLIITLVMAAIVLAIALAVSLKGGGHDMDDQRHYLDKDGDHVYYNESIIEKKEFRRKHPNEEPRSFGRLFRKK